MARPSIGVIACALLMSFLWSVFVLAGEYMIRYCFAGDVGDFVFLVFLTLWLLPLWIDEMINWSKCDTEEEGGDRGERGS